MIHFEGLLMCFATGLAITLVIRNPIPLNISGLVFCFIVWAYILLTPVKR